MSLDAGIFRAEWGVRLRSARAIASGGSAERRSPGFGLTLGLTLTWLGLIVLIPLGALFLKAAELGLAEFIWRSITEPPRAQRPEVSFGISLAAAARQRSCSASLVAWVLVRYDFPAGGCSTPSSTCPSRCRRRSPASRSPRCSRRTGCSARRSPRLGIQVAYTPLGILVALVFIGLPFVVRTVQPVLADLDAELEEAAATPRRRPLADATRVILPAICPAVLTGFALAFARGVGEYGSVIFIAGNMPYVSEIAPLLIVIKLEEFKYAGAAAIAMVMLVDLVRRPAAGRST